MHICVHPFSCTLRVLPGAQHALHGTAIRINMNPHVPHYHLCVHAAHMGQCCCMLAWQSACNVNRWGHAALLRALQQSVNIR